MSENGLAFLQSKASGRLNGGALAALDMLGRQAPAPDAPPILPPDVPGPAEAAAFVGQLATPRHRIVVSYGRGVDTYIIALEAAPDWDVVGTWSVSGQTATGIAWVIGAMLGPKGLKDYTGEFHALGPQAVSSDTAPAATDPRPARGQPAGPAPHGGRGRKDRPADPAVELGGTAHGPGGDGQSEALV